jgi:hypothetical protein
LLLIWVLHSNASENMQVSPRPPPNRACDFHRIRLSKVRHSSPTIARGSVSRFDFTFTRPTIPGASVTFLIRVAFPLPPFALWPAFPASDYYGGSDSSHRSSGDCCPPGGKSPTFTMMDSAKEFRRRFWYNPTALRGSRPGNGISQVARSFLCAGNWEICRLGRARDGEIPWYSGRRPVRVR